MSISEITGSAAGALTGGAIGALATEAQFTKNLKNRQRLALILAGAMSGAAAGAGLGDLKIKKKRKPAKIKTAGVNIKAILRQLGHRLEYAVQGKTLEDAKLKRSLVNRIRSGYKAMGELETKTAAVDEDAIANKVVARAGVAGMGLGSVYAASKAVADHMEYKDLKNNPLKHMLKGTRDAALKPFANPVEAMSLVTDYMSNKVSEGAGFARQALGAEVGTKAVGSAVDKGVQNFMERGSGLEALKKSRNKAAIAAGLLAAGGLALNKMSAFKFNPSILAESSDDVMEAYILYKQQKKMHDRELAAANATTTTN